MHTGWDDSYEYYDNYYNDDYYNDDNYNYEHYDDMNSNGYNEERPFNKQQIVQAVERNTESKCLDINVLILVIHVHVCM